MNPARLNFGQHPDLHARISLLFADVAKTRILFFVQIHCTQNVTSRMPRTTVTSNQRLSIRIDASQKELLMQAASIQSTDLTEFVTSASVSAARTVIEQHERLVLTERETAFLLDLLENPPAPNDKLLAAAAALPQQK